MLGLNRTTVSAAYELLESEGLIKGHVGRGSFVQGPGASGNGLRWPELLAEYDAALPALPASVEISFATSRPAELLFPLDEFRAVCDEVMRSDELGAILQLGVPNGYAPLRAHLLQEAQHAGVARPSDDITITSGCQQALDLIQRVLTKPGDVVMAEDPVYPGLAQVFTRGRARLTGIPVGADGMDIDQLQRAIAREKPKLLLITSSFQNPTGATLPLPARHSLLRAARQAGTVVVENDIYADLRYEGSPLPSLKQLDETGDVILLRSFSKIAFPGLRVGWVIAPRPVTAALAAAKQWCDLHSDQFSQAVLLRFAESGRLRRHLERVVAAGTERLRAVLDACDRYLPAGSRCTRPQGGMNLWVELPDPLDSGELLNRAQRDGVSYLPGKFFAVSRPQPNGLRLSFAGLPPEKIRRGVEILGTVFSAEWERLRAARRREPAPAMV